MAASHGKCFLMAATVSLLCGGVFAQEVHRITIPAGELRWDEKGINLRPSLAECPSSVATGVLLEAYAGARAGKGVAAGGSP